MLADFTVDIPTDKCIYIYNKIYVRYCTDRKYDPDRKYNIPNHVTIGKLCPSDHARMYPNESYFKYFGTPVPDYSEIDSKPRVLRPAMYLVLRKMFAGNRRLLLNTRDKAANAVFCDSVASYMVTGRLDAREEYYATHYRFSDSDMTDIQLADMLYSTDTTFYSHWNDEGYYNIRLRRYPDTARLAHEIQRIRQLFDPDIPSNYSNPTLSSKAPLFEYQSMVWVLSLKLLSDIKSLLSGFEDTPDIVEVIASLDAITLTFSPINKYRLEKPLSSDQEQLLHALGLGKTTLNTFIRNLNQSN